MPSNGIRGFINFHRFFNLNTIQKLSTFFFSGLLDPPTITEPIEHSTAHLILTWTPPFTLNITDLDPDITYRVCNNDTNTCVYTADTSYIFPTTCFPVEYSVSACNPVGCSENATIISLPLPVCIQGIAKKGHYSLINIHLHLYYPGTRTPHDTLEG